MIWGYHYFWKHPYRHFGFQADIDTGCFHQQQRGAYDVAFDGSRRGYTVDPETCCLVCQAQGLLWDKNVQGGQLRPICEETRGSDCLYGWFRGWHQYHSRRNGNWQAALIALDLCSRMQRHHVSTGMGPRGVPWLPDGKFHEWTRSRSALMSFAKLTPKARTSSRPIFPKSVFGQSGWAQCGGIHFGCFLFINQRSWCGIFPRVGKIGILTRRILTMQMNNIANRYLNKSRAL